MPRRLIIIAAAFVTLVGVSVAVILIVRRSPTLQNTVSKLANLPTNANTSTVVRNVNSGQAASLEADRQRISYAARNFTERYGSGSNQNDFSHLVEAQAFVTKSYATVLRVQIAQGRLANVTVPYHGFVTKALVISFAKLTSTSAVVVISAQRQETTGADTKTYNQDLHVDLLKVGGAWQVNAAEWLAR